MRIQSKEKLFLFSQCSLRDTTLESGFLPYPKLCVFALQRTNSNWLFSVVWKMTTCWLFGGLILCTNHGRCLPLSADAYMVNSEWDSLMTKLPNANRGELKRNGLSTATILGNYYSQLTAYASHLLSLQPGECMRLSYFLVTLVSVQNPKSNGYEIFVYKIWGVPYNSMVTLDVWHKPSNPKWEQIQGEKSMKSKKIPRINKLNSFEEELFNFILKFNFKK